MALKRISAEPAFVLHRHDWSESSLILEVYTRNFGRLALVAKGAKKPSSNFRPVLLPLQRLSLAFTGEAEIRTLRSAEWVGGYPMPTGMALMAGFYLNELLMRLLAREDAYQALFDAYAQCVEILATQAPEVVELALRAFELALLKEVGLLPCLDVETMHQAPVQSQLHYMLMPDVGLVSVRQPQGEGLLGSVCLKLSKTLQSNVAMAFPILMQDCAGALPALKTQLRTLLLHHGGTDGFRTRALMRQLSAV